MPPKPQHPFRAQAIAMMRKGLATMSEVAALCGASRQAVRFWALEEGIDPVQIRWERLVSIWKKERAKT